jgi:hypothetical protein
MGRHGHVDHVDLLDSLFRGCQAWQDVVVDTLLPSVVLLLLIFTITSQHKSCYAAILSSIFVFSSLSSSCCGFEATPPAVSAESYTCKSVCLFEVTSSCALFLLPHQLTHTFALLKVVLSRGNSVDCMATASIAVDDVLRDNIFILSYHWWIISSLQIIPDPHLPVSISANHPRKISACFQQFCLDVRQ